MKLKIEKPDFQGMVAEYNYEGNIRGFDFSKLDAWFEETVEPINKLLAEGRFVYNNKNNNIGYIQAFSSTGDVTHMGFTHEGYLIGEKEIKKETAADVLRDMCEFIHSNYSSSFSEPIDYTELKPWLKKATKALGEGEEGGL